MRARELTENIGAYIREHMSESEKSAMRMEEYIKHSDLNAGGNNYTRTLQIPKIYDKKTIDVFSAIVDRTYGIFEKVIQKYLDDPEYRRLFPFSKGFCFPLVIRCRFQSAGLIFFIMKKPVILSFANLIRTAPAP